MGTMPGNIGPLEIAVVLIIALIVFGPKRLPELGRGLGKGMREFKETITGEKKADAEEDIDDDAKALSASTSTTPPDESPADRATAHDKTS